MRHAATIASIFVSMTVCALAAPVRAAPTADQLVARNVEARGGAAALRALRALRLTGKLVLDAGDGQSQELEWGLVQQRPGRARTERTMQGLTAVEAWDGREAWRVNPFEGRREAERLSADEARPLARVADLDGPLFDWKAKRHRVELLGTRDIDGTLAHELRVTRRDGDVQLVYLDPDAFLEIRIVTISRVRGSEVVTETDLGSYERVAGVWIPMSYEIGRRGAPRHARIVVERAEPNAPLDEALFRLPRGRVARAIVAGPAPKTAAPAPRPAPARARPPIVDAGVLSGLNARNIGSAAMSGRIAALAAYRSGGRTTVYVGAASGGVWKSTDGATTFEPVFDDQPVQSIGAITIDPSRPRTVWVGTGETWARNSVSFGNGVYKSTDGGETWRHMGLRATERIARILVHPKNGNVVYACATGPLWSDGAERGVYKTVDGGKRWARVLAGSSLSTGCSGLAMDPRNPDVLFAGLWDFRRKGWTFRSGGPGPDAPSGSGLFRTTDGGRRWARLDAASAKGLPAGPWGRVEVVVAPSNRRVVYALIEGKATALYRSSDGGATWEARDRGQYMVWRPFYFARLIVDPRNPERLFKPNWRLIVSEDGGRSFADAGGGSHGDWHDLWIDPTNPQHLIGGDDGGLWLSFDGGSRWWKGGNLPISQFYHVSVDDADPYRVYGGLQDNGTWVGPSAAPGGITNAHWQNFYFGDGFWTHVDPTDPQAVYAEMQGGGIGRVDRRTGASRDIQPTPGYREKLRFNWNAPIHVSPTRKGTMYLGAQFLFRSRDRGETWQRISPDLTTNDPEKQRQEESGGITVDNSAAEMHTTIHAISESPRNASVIWVGTDDGNLQLTRNGGKTWTNVAANVPKLPPHSWVSWVEASRHAAGTAYVAFDRHTFGDFDPWVYKTTDYGKSWTRIVAPAQGVRGWAHVVKEDLVRPSLLFVGTELGLWISLDGGRTWAEFKGGGFPSVAVRDLVIHPREHDLVIATHGRGIWIVDDLTPLRALDPGVLGRAAAFLPGRPAQQRLGGYIQDWQGDAAFVGENPPGGAVVTFYQRARHLFGPLRLEVVDPSGKVIETLSPPKRRGINRVSWSMQLPPPRVPRAATVAYSASSGPRVLPGTYTLRLVKGDEVIEGKLQIKLDRRAPFRLADRKAQLATALRAHALFGQMSDLVEQIDAMAGEARARRAALPAGDTLAGRLDALVARLDETKKLIVATKEGGAITGEERLREHLDDVYGAILRWEGRPTRYQRERVEVLRRELGDVARAVKQIVAGMVRPLDDELQSRRLRPIPTGAATKASGAR